MKNGIIKRTLSTALAGFLVVSSIPSVAKEVTVQAATVLQTSPSHTREEGTVNGYHHEIWQADTPNSSTMTLGDNAGAFSTSWKCGPNGSRGNFLARRGLFYGRNTGKHWQDHGNFTCQFDCEWSAGSSGNSRICIYGWTENPLVEYYIIEDWKNWVPSSNNAKQATIDGSSYDIFTNAMNSYNITGSNGPFTQYISVRKNRRTSGTISIYKHFETWESMGMKMGDFYEVAFNVEGWESDGQANVKKNIITTDGSGEDTTEGPTEPVTEPSDGVYFKESFESGAGKFEGRGSASVATDTKNYYSGSKSLFVSGRTDYWNGAAIALDSSKFKPGQTYSFSTGVLQKSGSPVEIKFTIQQGSGDSADYHEVASVTAKSGEWTKVENTKFTIPSGSSDLILYVEAPESLTDFYIDDVLAAVKGTSSSVVTGKGTVDSSSTPTPGPTTETGLKNVFAKYFRLGTCVPVNEVRQHSSFVLKHFNSITCENEMKPQYLFDAEASAASGDNTNPKCKLHSDAKTILDWAVKNNMAVRGHTLIWHSQTPSEFFREGFRSNGAYVSKDVMNKRIENWIKNVFDMIKTNYPTLKLYAYDIANECFADGMNGLRAAGDGGETSPWTKIYGDDSFLEVAFTAARKYAPEGCKLFYNDYNEYDEPKVTNIYNLCKKLYAKGILDGVGMQSHLDVSNGPSVSKYQQALERYASIGCEIHVTELDATNNSESAQATYLENIVKSILNCDKVTSLTFWGTNDNGSWRRNQNPLIFNGSYQPKQAYNKIVALVPESDWADAYIGDQEPTTKPTEPTEPPTEEDPFKDVTVWGDANCSGGVKMNDAVLVMQVVANEDEYGVDGAASTHITSIGSLNADVYQAGSGLTSMDALSIQKFLIGAVKTLPESYKEKKTNVTTTTKKIITVTTTTTPKTVASISDSFESGKGNWTGRGDASVSLDSKSYYDGSKSLFVSGRADNWNGAAMTLDSTKFAAGNTYSFSAAVMQPTTSEEEIQLTLQYNDASGKENYAKVASVSAKGRTWTKLENTSYTIPEGATDLLLYFEMPNSYSDFYVDAVVIGNEGTKSSVVTGGGTVEEFKTVEPSGDFPDPSKPMIGISFDDGASPSNNKRIVDALAKQGFTATFFYIGNNTQSADAQNEVKYAYSKGMEIANHTMSHPYLSQKSSSEIRQEVDNCHKLLTNILGVEPSKLLRLPYLDGGGAVKSTLTDYGLVSCAIDTKDYNKVSKDSIVNTIKQAMNDGSGNGAVVLMHETEGNTVAAIEELAPYIKAQGWQIVSISQMYAAKGKAIPKNGQIISRVY